MGLSRQGRGRPRLGRHINNFFPELRDRLMAGHGPLKPSILVRIQVPQFWEKVRSILVRSPVLSFSGGGNPSPAVGLDTVPSDQEVSMSNIIQISCQLKSLISYMAPQLTTSNIFPPAGKMLNCPNLGASNQSN